MTRFFKISIRYPAFLAGLLCVSLSFGCWDRRPADPDADATRDTASGDLAPRADTSAEDAADTRTRPDLDSGTDTAPDTGSPDTTMETGGDGKDAADTGETTIDGTDADPSVCGDDVVEGDEACDDGNTDDGDYCASDCSMVTGRCGDGDLQANETCDDGEITSGCATKHDGGDGTCVPPGECADGFTMQDGSCVEEQLDKHVHISISNTCKLSVSPESVEVPRGQTVSFVYHNHSTDYAADVWLSYQGGYLDLKQGNTWDDSFVHCENGNRPYSAYADISINGIDLRDSSCPGHRMSIECK